MAIVYKSCDLGEDLAHFCDPCGDVEHGGLRGAFFIKENTNITATSTRQQWEDAINAGNVFFIPETRGTYDGGAEKKGNGYGDSKERRIGFDFTASFKDPNYLKNIAFWEWMERPVNKFKFGFRTETLVKMTDVVVSITEKTAVEEDTESEVVPTIEVKWYDTNKPTSFAWNAIKELFNCFELGEINAPT